MFWQTHAPSERYLDEHHFQLDDCEPTDEPVKFEWDEMNLGHLPATGLSEAPSTPG